LETLKELNDINIFENYKTKYLFDLYIDKDIIILNYANFDIDLILTSYLLLHKFENSCRSL